MAGHHCGRGAWCVFWLLKHPPEVSHLQLSLQLFDAHPVHDEQHRGAHSGGAPEDGEGVCAAVQLPAL